MAARCLALDIKHHHYLPAELGKLAETAADGPSRPSPNHDRRENVHMILKRKILVVAVAAAGASMMAAASAQAAPCGHSWAEPGTYKITGNFRGKTESAGAALTRDCRVDLKIPGVYTGGRVRKAGNCLRFTFKIDEEKRLFRGRWCDGFAVVNWKGKDVRAEVKKVRQGAK
jgi:hypothetical protein